MTASQDRAARLAELHRHLAGQMAQWAADGYPRLALTLHTDGASLRPGRKRAKRTTAKDERTKHHG